MAQTHSAEAPITRESLKQAIKEVLVETFDERRDFFEEVVAEAIEDIGMLRAIEEGRKSDLVSRGEVFDVLEGRS